MKDLVLKLQKLGSFNVWRHLVNFWAFVFFAAIIYDFVNENFLSHNEILLAIAAVYGTALAIYSAEKEFRRWHDIHTGVHPGEMYSIIWTILMLGIIIAQIILKLDYHMPAEVTASYVAVLSILAITRESKNSYKRKRGTTSDRK